VNARCRRYPVDRLNVELGFGFAGIVGRPIAG
jgi:hypothetical protein